MTMAIRRDDKEGEACEWPQLPPRSRHPWSNPMDLNMEAGADAGIGRGSGMNFAVGFDGLAAIVTSRRLLVWPTLMSTSTSLIYQHIKFGLMPFAAIMDVEEPIGWRQAATTLPLNSGL